MEFIKSYKNELLLLIVKFISYREEITYKESKYWKCTFRIISNVMLIIFKAHIIQNYGHL